MKKITKIWVLLLALVACITVLNANAQTTMDTKQVSLTLSGWSNSCTIVDYPFGAHDVSVNPIALGEKTGAITCQFLENPQATVSVSLANLQSAADSIAYDNFQFKVDADNAPQWMINPLTATAYTTFENAAQSIYVKDENKLWSWASTLTLSWTVPAWKPSGTYTWNLNLTIQ